jgi:CHAT domain-containing protein/tetratricopeptide (TPR) repeat protein
MSFRTPARAFAGAIAAAFLLTAPSPVAEGTRSSRSDCGPDAYGIAERAEQGLFGLPFAGDAPEPKSTGTAAVAELERSDPRLAEAEKLSRSWRGDDKRTSVDLFDDLLALSVARSDSALERMALVRLGDLHRSLGRNSESIGFYRRALLVGADDTLGIEARMGLSRTLLRLDDFDTGREEALKAVASSRVLGDPLLEARALTTLGIACYYPDPRASVSILERAVALLQELEEERSLAEAVLYLGFAHSDLNEEWTARKEIERALGISRNGGHREIESLALQGLGHLLSKIGEKQEALELYYAAAPLVEEVGDPYDAIPLYTGMGYLHAELGDFEVARDLHLRAVALSKQIASRTTEAANLIHIGRLHAGMDEPERALASFLEARRLLDRVEARQLECVVLGEMALARADMGREEEALETFDQAIGIARENGFERDEADLLNGMGTIELQSGRIAEARERFQRALALSRKTASPFAESRALFNLARLERDRGRLEEALAMTEEALLGVESLRSKISSHRLRVSYVASVYDLHAFHVELLMELERGRPGSGFLERAFLAADRGRSRALLETLVQTDGDGFAAVDPALVDYETRLEERIREEAARPSERCAHDAGPSARSAELRHLLAELDRVRAVLRRRGSPEAPLAASELPGMIELRRELLDERTGLLAYFLGERVSYLWAVSRSGVSVHSLPPRERIESEASRLYELLAGRERRKGETEKERYDRVRRSDAEYWRTAQALSEMLLGEATLSLDVERLVVVGDGALNRIPFSALPQPGSDAIPVPRPMVTRYEIVRLPSVAIWKALDGRRPASAPREKRLAVLADPVLDARDPRLASGGAPTLVADASTLPHLRGLPSAISRMPRLISTREEAKRILKLVPEGQGLEALGFDANLGLVASGELADYEVVHFATHGIVNSEHPELSGIVLSLFDPEGNGEKGFLRLHDIYDLKLPVRLVVLSACGTGIGKEIRGEGLIGLVGGFLSSGTQGVVASYWDVEDEATAELMSRFYRHLFVEGLSPSKSLQKAQGSMWNESRWLSPALWGAFEFQGLWE